MRPVLLATAAVLALPLTTPASAEPVVKTARAQSFTASTDCVLVGEVPGAVEVVGVGSSANTYTIVHCTAYQNGVKIIELHGKRQAPVHVLVSLPKTVGAGPIFLSAGVS